jgi:hypothetical protein
MIKEKIDRFAFVLKRTGFKKAVKAAIESVFIRPVTSRMGYIQFNSLYPQHLIFIAGFAKGGSSWFAHMLSSLPGFCEYTPSKWTQEGENASGIYNGFVSEFYLKLAVVKGHTWGYTENVRELRKQGAGKYIITVRDPRDCLISAYWYIKRRPCHWDYDKVTSLGLEDYITDKLESGEFKDRFVRWLELWIENADENALFVRYENLLADTKSEMKRVFDFIDFSVSDELLDQIISQQSFENKAKRTRGRENTNSFLRKGVASEWHEVFSDHQKQLSEEQCGDAVQHLIELADHRSRQKAA